MRVFQVQDDWGMDHLQVATRPDPKPGPGQVLLRMKAAALNYRDLTRLGAAPGEMIRVETRRGILELKARVDRAVPEGVVFIPFCYAEAPANFLTNPQLDPYGKIPEFKFCAARLGKVGNAEAAE